jgi:hypothetical protein
MPLAQTIIDRIRDEIGNDEDVTDAPTVPAAPVGDLETIYIDENRGDFSTLRTALIVWRRRLANMQTRSFDSTAGGSLMARSQRIRYLQRRVKELEILVDYTLKGTNQTVLSNAQQVEDSAEF